MFNWDEMERGKMAAVASAKMAALGLPKEHLVPGAMVTISPCKCTGDRSFKRNWQDMPPTQQAGIRCDDAVFVAFLKEQHPDDWREAEDAAD